MTNNEKEMYLILCGWAQYPVNHAGYYPLMWYRPRSGYLPLSLEDAFDVQKEIDK
jgi:hypothetical protein